MRKLKSVFLVSCLCLISISNVFAESAGQAIYQKNCVTCHGETGLGLKEQKAPKLAGQHAWYLVIQLENFQKGVRNNPAMLPYIKNLSKSDFEAVAEFLSKLPTE